MVGGTGGIDVVGEPLAYGMGFVALLGAGFSRYVGQYFATLAHEGGHALAAVIRLRPPSRLTLSDNGGGVTYSAQPRWTFGNILVGFSGYAAPSLFGLAGAALIADGNVLGALLAVLVLATLTLLITDSNTKDTGLATLITVLVIVGVGYVVLVGSANLQAITAVGLVWFLLIKGLVDAATIPFGSGKSDPEVLAKKTLIPGRVGQLAWIVIAVVALYVGGRLLLVPGA
jgi:hypothetical protein